jgi:hypothetical protein
MNEKDHSTSSQSGQLFPDGNQPLQSVPPLPPGYFPPNQQGQPAPLPSGYFPPNQPSNIMPQQRHEVPRCMSCGTITQWNVEPLFLLRHFIIGGLLLLFFGSGLLYFLIVAIIRSSSKSRSKICPNCGARNLWTFIY